MANDIEVEIPEGYRFRGYLEEIASGKKTALTMRDALRILGNRKPKHPDEHYRRIIPVLRLIGRTPTQIAAYLRINLDLLYQHYTPELEGGADSLKVLMTMRMVDIAMQGSNKDAISAIDKIMRGTGDLNPTQKVSVTTKTEDETEGVDVIDVSSLTFEQRDALREAIRAHSERTMLPAPDYVEEADVVEEGE